jgi:hypothetical protein
MSREGQIPAVVRSRLPVAHAVHRDPEQDVSRRLGLVSGEVLVAWQTVFGRARERGRHVCQEAEGVAHGYHHAPSPHDVHRVGRGRTGATRDERHGARAHEDRLQSTHGSVCQVALPLREEVKAQVLRQARARAVAIKGQIAEHHGRAVHAGRKAQEPHAPLQPQETQLLREASPGVQQHVCVPAESGPVLVAEGHCVVENARVYRIQGVARQHLRRRGRRDVAAERV